MGKLASSRFRRGSAAGAAIAALRPLLDTDTMLLAFPPDIWEIIFELLSVQDLQLISKVRSPTSPPDASLTQSSLGP